jgi:hypothetical protein
VKKEAAQSAFRMLDSIKPNTGDMQGYLMIYKISQNIIDLHPLSDTLPERQYFDAPFEVKKHERDAWVCSRIYLEDI